MTHRLCLCQNPFHLHLRLKYTCNKDCLQPTICKSRWVRSLGDRANARRQRRICSEFALDSTANDCKPRIATYWDASDGRRPRPMDACRSNGAIFILVGVASFWRQISWPAVTLARGARYIPARILHGATNGPDGDLCECVRFIGIQSIWFRYI